MALSVTFTQKGDGGDDGRGQDSPLLKQWCLWILRVWVERSQLGPSDF